MYTAGNAWLEALNDAGIAFIFANLGSDHPGIIEALAEVKALGRAAPRLITCPNEMVALSAAHGYAQVSGRPQVVLIHVECGTQALGGAVHNAARCRVPVLIFAGASPVTQEGELRGGRNEFIHWLQDVFDQRGIVRGYMKYENELRSGRTIKQMMFRALQLAQSDPGGPAYLMAAREVLEAEVPRVDVDPANWPALEPCALPASGVVTIAAELMAAKRPLIVTSYLGRRKHAVDELVRLAERLGIGVLDSAPVYTNFPANHSMYQGSQTNEPVQNPVLADADVILILDCDVPWIPLVNRPSAGARIYHVDVDPLKERIPMWYIATKKAFRADVGTALRQINEYLDTVSGSEVNASARRAHYAALHLARAEQLLVREKPSAGSAITPEYLTACVRQQLSADAIVLNEGITNYTAIHAHIGAAFPQAMYASGGSALGWSGGAAIGAKLAAPDRMVVSLTGDGSYMFSVPSSVHWIARRYKTPFLQIVYNNGGWKAPRFSTLGVHPDGFASREADLGISFEPAPDYSGIAAAAGGAFARIVRDADELPDALREAVHAVIVEERCAVLDVVLDDSPGIP